MSGGSRRANAHKRSLDSDEEDADASQTPSVEEKSQAINTQSDRSADNEPFSSARRRHGSQQGGQATRTDRAELGHPPANHSNIDRPAAPPPAGGGPDGRHINLNLSLHLNLTGGWAWLAVIVGCYMSYRLISYLFFRLECNLRSSVNRRL
eukprot:g1992.t1